MDTQFVPVLVGAFVTVPVTVFRTVLVVRGVAVIVRVPTKGVFV